MVASRTLETFRCERKGAEKGLLLRVIGAVSKETRKNKPLDAIIALHHNPVNVCMDEFRG
jgi:hypothetical protein